MFVARPPASPLPARELPLARAGRRAFTGSAEFLSDPENRDRIAEYLTDVARAYGREGLDETPARGQSYGEMARALIESTVPADEPVDLLVLAFAIHDLRPGRQTAAYLSHVTPGAPMAFAICDQGSAATFSGLRIARDYAASAGVRRSLVLAVEQADLPYRSSGPMPARHQAVALLLGESATASARVVQMGQHPGVAPSEVAARAAHELKELIARHPQAVLVLGESLAAQWKAPDAPRVRVAPPGQPMTGLWWAMIDELESVSEPGIVIVADYEPQLHYLSYAVTST